MDRGKNNLWTKRLWRTEFEGSNYSILPDIQMPQGLRPIWEKDENSQEGWSAKTATGNHMTLKGLNTQVPFIKYGSICRTQTQITEVFAHNLCIFSFKIISRYLQNVI